VKLAPAQHAPSGLDVSGAPTYAPAMIEVPSAPAESRPPYVTSDEQIHRWNLCVAVAPKILGEDATAAELWQITRLMYNDPVGTTQSG
jgi:hypothetical protein